MEVYWSGTLLHTFANLSYTVRELGLISDPNFDCRHVRDSYPMRSESSGLYRIRISIADMSEIQMKAVSYPAALSSFHRSYDYDMTRIITLSIRGWAPTWMVHRLYATKSKNCLAPSRCSRAIANPLAFTCITLNGNRRHAAYQSRKTVKSWSCC